MAKNWALIGTNQWDTKRGWSFTSPQSTDPQEFTNAKPVMGAKYWKFTVLVILLKYGGGGGGGSKRLSLPVARWPIVFRKNRFFRIKN